MLLCPIDDNDKLCVFAIRFEGDFIGRYVAVVFILVDRMFHENFKQLKLPHFPLTGKLGQFCQYLTCLPHVANELKDALTGFCSATPKLLNILGDP